ncbi:MAG: hypothetical protein PQ964_03460 [Methanobacteriaceae archaeon]|jgi:hypothetical protein
MTKELENKIKEALKDVRPWQKVPTSVNGVYLVKTPADNSKGTIMIEINPMDERGSPMKRRGLFLKNTIEFNGFKSIFQNKSVMDLLDTIEEIDGREKKKKVKTIEI